MISEDNQTPQLPQTDVMQSVLKASHLRIGNLLYIPQLKDNFEIGTIYENGRFLTKNNKHSFSSIECANPIPLSEEWLLKFDFYVRDVFGQKQYFLSGITIYVNDGKFQHSGYDRKIKYVHELQNLYFALTQRELTVA